MYQQGTQPMSAASITVLSMLVALVAVPLAEKAYDPLTIALAVPLAALVAIVILGSSKQRAASSSGHNRQKTQPAAPVLRCFVIGALIGATIAGSSITASYLIRRIPAVRDSLLDLDRPRIERLANAAENEHRWKEAAAALVERATRPLSRRWAGDLHRRAYIDVLEAAAVATEVAEKRRLYNECDTLARKCNPQRTIHLEPARLLATLSALTSRFESDRHTLANEYYEALLQYGAATPLSFADRAGLYAKAKRIAARFGLDTATADKRLATLADQQRASAAADLPAHVEARVQRAWLEPVVHLLFVDVDVHDAAGQPVAALNRKDFRLSQSDTTLPILAFGQVQPRAAPLQLVVLVDTSSSTAGRPLEQAKRGVQQLVAKLTPHVSVTTLAFADDVQTLHAWTQEPAVLEAALAPVTANGATGLYHGLETALNELADRPTPKAILICTDGHDTVGTPSEEAILARVRSAPIPIFAVALTTNDNDHDALRRIVQESGGGGRFVPVADVADLDQVLANLAAALSRPAYRMAVSLPSPTSGPVLLHIGGRNAVSCPITLPASSDAPSPATPLHHDDA